MGYSRKELKDPNINIKVGVMLIKRIADRVQPSAIETIASVYNDLGTKKVISYGVRVKAIYDEKLWILPPSFFEKIGMEFSKFENLNPSEQYELLRKIFGDY